MRGVVCLLTGGPTYRLRVGAKMVFHFEFSEYMGPGVLNSKGNPIGGHGLPPRSSPFWGAFQRWFDGGRQVDSDGNCILPAQPITTPKKGGGR